MQLILLQKCLVSFCQPKTKFLMFLCFCSNNGLLIRNPFCCFHFATIFFIFLLRNPWNPYKASTSVGECEWWQSSLCRVQREGVIVVVEIGRCTTRCASDLNLKARLLRHFCNRWCTEHTNKACSEEKVCDGKAS